MSLSARTAQIRRADTELRPHNRGVKKGEIDMKRTTRIGVLIAVALPLLAVAFYIRYRPDLEDRLLPPIITIKSPLNGSTLKNTRVKVEICCERIRTKGYSLSANLNGNRINHKLGIKGSCFSGIVKCDSGYNLLKVEIYRECSPSPVDCRPGLLSHAISRFTVIPAKSASRDKVVTGPPSTPGGEDVKPLPEEKTISYKSRISKVGADVPVGPDIAAETPLAPTEASRTVDEDEGTSGLLVQDRDETGEDDDEPPGPPPDEDDDEPQEQPPDEEADKEDEPGDTIPPLVTINNPKGNSIVFSRNLNVAGSTEPNTLVEIVDPYASTQSNVLGGFSFPQIIFNEGRSSLTVRATDAAGNIGTETVNFTIDTTKPAIDTPVCGGITNQPVQDVSGSANPGIQVTLINPRTGGLLITLAESSGEYLFPSVTFNEGMNQVIVTVSDTEGRTKSVFCSLLVDTNPPLVKIDNPKNTSIHSILKLDVYGSTEPNILVEIVNPYSSTLSDGLGNFSFPQVSFKEGSNSLTVKATDAAGNIGTTTVNFRIDITRPQITCDNGLECSNTIDIAGRTEPYSKVELPDWGLETISDSEGNFIFPNVGPFPDGENTIKLRATDLAGNISFDTVHTFEVDTTPPVVNLTSPQDGGIINPRTQDVTGITEPFCPGVELFVHRTGERREAGSDDNGHFVFPGIAFPEGPNTLTVKATDRCGWEGSSTISFFAEPDFYRVTMDFCDELENPLDPSEVSQFKICVYVNLPDEGRSLGAYHFFISFDPEVVQLQRISGGDAVEFSSVSARVSNSIDPETGLATSFFFEANNGRTGWEAPSGMDINVAKLTFNVIDSGISTLALRIRTLSDNNRQPISGFVKNGFVEIQ